MVSHVNRLRKACRPGRDPASSNWLFMFFARFVVNTACGHRGFWNHFTTKSAKSTKEVTQIARRLTFPV